MKYIYKLFLAGVAGELGNVVAGVFEYMQRLISD